MASVHWGRGIRKICEACRELGGELPVFEMRGTGLRVRFKALESALVGSGGRAQTDIQTDMQGNPLAPIGRLGKEIMVLVKSNPTLTIPDMARKMDVTSRTIEREVSKLRAAKKIARIGGKRFDQWIVL